MKFFQHSSYIVMSCFLFFGLLGGSCEKTLTGGNGTGTGNFTPRIVSNLYPEVSRVLYYSFDGDTTIAASLAGTDTWDVELPSLTPSSRSVDVFLNSGNKNSFGKTLGIVVDSTFDLVTVAPPDSVFRTEDTASSRRIVSIDLLGKGMFNYNSAQHTITPNPQKTLILKTRSGTYVKVQFVNLYKDAVAMPTIQTPLGYYRLRYVKSATRQLK